MEAGLTELRALVAAASRAASASATADRSASRARRLYLVSRTSHLAEGWCDRVPAIELAADAGSAGLGEAVREAGRSLGVEVVWESPADVIPLPTGWEERSLGTAATAEVTGPAAIGDGRADPIELRHFDPYSVVLRRHRAANEL
jgi:hypothetical protein